MRMLGYLITIFRQRAIHSSAILDDTGALFIFGGFNGTDVLRLIARDTNENEDALRRTWEECAKECHCKRSRFNFEEFSHLVHRYL